MTFLGPTTGLVSVDCSLITLFTAQPTSTGRTSPPGSSSSSTTTPLPVWLTWPPGQVEPVTTTVSKPEPTDRGSKQPCSECLRWSNSPFLDRFTNSRWKQLFGSSSSAFARKHPCRWLVLSFPSWHLSSGAASFNRLTSRIHVGRQPATMASDHNGPGQSTYVRE